MLLRFHLSKSWQCSRVLTVKACLSFRFCAWVASDREKQTPAMATNIKVAVRVRPFVSFLCICFGLDQFCFLWWHLFPCSFSFCKLAKGDFSFWHVTLWRCTCELGWDRKTEAIFGFWTLTWWLWEWTGEISRWNARGEHERQHGHTHQPGWAVSLQITWLHVWSRVLVARRLPAPRGRLRGGHVRQLCWSGTQCVPTVVKRLHLLDETKHQWQDKLRSAEVQWFPRKPNWLVLNPAKFQQNSKHVFCLQKDYWFEKPHNSRKSADMNLAVTTATTRTTQKLCVYRMREERSVQFTAFAFDPNNGGCKLRLVGQRVAVCCSRCAYSENLGKECWRMRGRATTPPSLRTDRQAPGNPTLSWATEPTKVRITTL